MAPVGITARFPLGVYHGHASDGSPDPLPSPARLLSALVSAAHTGTTARSDGEMDTRVTAALEWLEQHPPSGIRVPATMRAGVSSRRVFMHRRTGTIEKDKNKTETRTVSDGYALGGAVGWTWDDMPDEVRDVLDRLCEDTPCLGETDSLVVLRINDVEPNWILDTTATAFTPGGLRIQVAAPGRIAILENLYARAHPGRAPAAADDRFRPASDAVRTFPTSEECLRTERYAPAESDRHEDEQRSPWLDVLVFPADDGTGQEIVPERRLGWCVAFHRALVSRIGDGAPAVVTGRYPAGMPVPANRMAIQYAPASVLAQSAVTGMPSSPGAFMVMLPSGIGGDETTVILRALAGMTRLRSRWGEMRLRPMDEIISTRAFWRSPATGIVRLWSPTPVAVPEVTRQRGSWAFEDAILLSLGFVWRDELRPVPRGVQGYRSLVAQVREHNAGVMWYRRFTRNPSAYAHKMPEGMVAQPYTALISIGELSSDTALVSVGQSRHLGGGLLVPADLPAELVQSAVRRKHGD